ncbi:hypothetical protein CFOL_v3_12722 [Cephalotus follicularis]|uniref:Exo_endo_phos domain-containing protein n=1 Tax=Cephalotus follicularis TaxID=3775 RepID=A0A1Q3BMG7_CEPFO|nr:hypothetical protein CFOL_v3_12722 [Cephalotus follicularis]
MCDSNARRTLWNDLMHCANRFKHEPWTVLGEFNVTRYGAEPSNGMTKAMQEFNNANTKPELEDLKGTGFHFTWNNMRMGTEAVLKKLDRALGNWQWFRSMGDSFAQFHPPGILDHSPVSIHLRHRQPYKGRPFKILNFWTDSEKFLHIVKQEWDKEYTCSPLIVIHKKLKSLKGSLRYLSTRPDSIAKELRLKLHSVQQVMVSGDMDQSVVVREMQLWQEVGRAARLEEAFFKQKSRIQWLKEGDSNLAYFHKMVKVRQSKNHIVRIRNEAGVWVESEGDIA